MKNTLKFFWPVLLMIFVIDETVLLVTKYTNVWWLQLAVIVSIIIGLFFAYKVTTETKKEIIKEIEKDLVN